MTVEEFAAYRSVRLSDSGQFDSIYALVKEAARIYLRHYGTFFAIYALAVVPSSSVVLALEAMGGKGSWLAIFLTLVTGIVAFSAVAVATSDVALGNRPSIARSYRRALGRRGLAVLVNSVISCVIVSLPVLVGWALVYGAVQMAATKLGGDKAVLALYFLLAVSAPAIIMNTMMGAVLVMYVPIISALEMRVNSWRAIRRSVSLGRHHRMRGVTIIAVGVVTFLLVASLLNVLMQRGLETSRLVVGGSHVVVNLLVTPMFYIAAILLYFDLRSRKEGYGFAELAEDIY